MAQREAQRLAAGQNSALHGEPLFDELNLSLTEFYPLQGFDDVGTFAQQVNTQPETVGHEAPRCWGAILSARYGCCDDNFQPDGKHLSDKVCERCHSEGSRIPVSRVRALHDGQERRFTNGHTAGLFSQAHPNLPMCRLINHTRDCTGARLVIFEREPPEHGEFHNSWATIPEEWVESGGGDGEGLGDDGGGSGGFVRLWASNGTFVAKRPRKRRNVREVSSSRVSREKVSSDTQPHDCTGLLAMSPASAALPSPGYPMGNPIMPHYVHPLAASAALSHPYGPQYAGPHSVSHRMGVSHPLGVSHSMGVSHPMPLSHVALHAAPPPYHAVQPHCFAQPNKYLGPGQAPPNGHLPYTYASFAPPAPSRG